MIVIVSWYADGSGQPEVEFRKIAVRNEEVCGVGDLIRLIRDTRDKECRAWEVTDKWYLLYDSVIPAKERQQ